MNGNVCINGGFINTMHARLTAINETKVLYGLQR